MDYIANIATGIPAKFHVKITKMPYALDKSIIDYLTLTIGSSKHSCVNITIPVRESNAIFMDHIDSTKPGSPCTIDDTVIKGEKTKEMFYFAATLIKNMTNKRIVEFTDQSHFPCAITETEIRHIPLNLSYLMFYGKTWYDKLFNAKLVDPTDQAKYELLQARRKDPLFKPASFHFKTFTLNEALLPIYDKTNTWEEFFQEINKIYGNRKCKVVYMWLTDAVRTLTVGSNDMFGFQKWYIDITNMPLVYYTPLKVYGGGHTRNRSKTRKQNIYEKLYNPKRDIIPRSVDFELFSDPSIFKG